MRYSIMGPASAGYQTVAQNAVTQNASNWYMKALVAIWWAGPRVGVDPVVMAGQCAIETGWGRFGGAVSPEHYNLCGLKTTSAVGDSGHDFQVFPAPHDEVPYQGALAQAHHLAAYSGFEAPLDTPDPRYHLVGPGTRYFGSALDIYGLSGRWAVDTAYGSKIESAINRLVAP